MNRSEVKNRVPVTWKLWQVLHLYFVLLYLLQGSTRMLNKIALKSEKIGQESLDHLSWNDSLINIELNSYTVGTRTSCGRSLDIKRNSFL